MTDYFAFIYLHKQKVTLNGHTFVKRAPICLSPTNTTAQASRSSIGVLQTWIKPPRKKRLSTVSSMGAALAAAETARMTKVAALATTQHSLLERKVCVVCACVCPFLAALSALSSPLSSPSLSSSPQHLRTTTN